MRIFIDTEFTDIAPGAELLSVGMVSEAGGELYIELSDADRSGCSDFVHEHVLPLFGRHKAEVLTREHAAIRIEEWLDGQRGGDRRVQIEVLSDSQWDWQFLIDLFPHVAGNPTWAKRMNVAGVLAQWSLAEFQEIALFEHIQEYHDTRGEQHHALVDARALRYAWNQVLGGK